MVDAKTYVLDNFNFWDLVEIYDIFSNLDRTGIMDDSFYFKNECAKMCKYYEMEYNIDFFRKWTMDVLLSISIDKIKQIKKEFQDNGR